jgi:hypothetical protein
MSNLRFVRIAALAAIGTCLVAVGMARAETGDDELTANVASSVADCDYGWHPRIHRRHHLVRHGLPRVHLAHRGAAAPQPRLASIRHEPPPFVVADNGNPAALPIATPVAGLRCSGPSSFSLLCPGAQVIGVTY